MPVFNVNAPGTRWRDESGQPGARFTVTGPDGIPAVENVALLSSAAHFRFTGCEPMVTLIVTGSIASLNASFMDVAGSISFPSFNAVPSPAVIAVTRGMMIVVNVHCAALTR